MQKVSFSTWYQTSLLNGDSSNYLEQLYESYAENKNAISSDWQNYFEQLPINNNNGSLVSHRQIQTQFKELARQPQALVPAVSEIEVKKQVEHQNKQARIKELVDAYRLLGHLQAKIDPLPGQEKPRVPELMLTYYHFSEADLEENFAIESLPGPKLRSLQKIVDDLQKIYCGSIASEFMHIADSPERIWIQQQVENIPLQPRLLPEVKQRLLENLIAAEGLEKYLGAKYPGAKRFSLEGTDTLIVALDTLIQQGGASEFKEIVLCMAHRGRLNVLVNLLGKTPHQLFDEFEGKHYGVKLESGDVKYHQGFSSTVSTSGGNVHLVLAFNPSHLEIVTPVICGSVKARQERRKDQDYSQVLSIAIHGDAAFSGQGVVMETLNMSQTRGFKIGGTIHIITNNQIGFTTSNVQDARSTLYCSDIGKMLGAPIFHVNADDPEAVYQVMKLALQYRMKFKKDIIIDLIGYRRQGHNEADEPAVTQPRMYQIIKKLPTVSTLYANKLIAENLLSKEEVDKKIDGYREALENKQQSVVRNLVVEIEREYMGNWPSYSHQDWRMTTDTTVEKSILKILAEKMTAVPEGFLLHPRVQKIINDRQKMTAEELPLDWGYAEILAYATLVHEGYAVRLSGQDVGRGTFFHRHAVLYNQLNNDEYVSLQELSPDQGKFELVCSLLSEQAVVGFEYGFAKTEPNSLVIWEAQFGDFANNAQVVIDQFISSGEQKWGQLCGLTLFLPHGYEGQGAEHSSARLERYLQLCAEHNMQVCIPTTPAQLFHMLRRQVLRPMRKPLIVLTPKSFLRHKLAISTLSELSESKFSPLLVEKISIVPRKIILCSGKVYYDLVEERQKQNKLDILMVRIEQLYPFPDIELQALLKQYSETKDIIWCQEEPKNQGAWYHIYPYLMGALGEQQNLRYAGREAAAAPAVGYHHLHQEQQMNLIKDALN